MKQSAPNWDYTALRTELGTVERVVFKLAPTVN